MAPSDHALLQEGLVWRRDGERAGDAVLRWIARQGWPCPTTAVVLGSGLGELADSLNHATSLNYREIPGFPAVTAPGHRGRLVIGDFSGQPVLMLQGRCHAYEGASWEAVTCGVRLMAKLGVSRVLLTCAAGGLADDLQVGDCLVLEDHIDLQFRGCGLTLPAPRAGWRRPYDPALRLSLQQCAERIGLRCRAGVYAAVTGPNFETRAELRFLRCLADAVGMSTTCEAMAAHGAGLQVAGLATITNLCRPDEFLKADSHDVLNAAAALAPRLTELIRAVLADHK